MLVCVCMSMVEGHTLTARTHADYTTHTLREDPVKMPVPAVLAVEKLLMEKQMLDRFSAAHFVKNL